MELKRGGECILSDDNTNFAAKYTVDGDEVALTVPLGLVSKASFEGDTLVMRDPVLLGGDNNKRFLKEGPNGQLPEPEREPAPPPPPPKPEIPEQYIGTWTGQDTNTVSFTFIIERDGKFQVSYRFYAGGRTSVGECKIEGSSFEANTNGGFYAGHFQGDKLIIVDTPGDKKTITLSKRE